MQFWLNNPTILLNKKYVFDFWPQPHMSFVQKMNAISRVVILLTLLGTLVTKSMKILVSGIVTLLVICYLHHVKQDKFSKEIEGFDTNNMINKNFQGPNQKNPMMNVMLSEYNDDPGRKPAAPAFNPIVAEDIKTKVKENISKEFNDANIDSKLFANLGDKLEFENSMRNYHAMPVTQVPSDQMGFAEFCYGSMKSCKEDNLECTGFV